MVTSDFLKTVKKGEDFIEKAQVRVLDQLHAKLLLRCRWSGLKKNEYKDIGEQNILYCRKGYNSLIPLCIQNEKRCAFFTDNNPSADPNFVDKIDEEIKKRNS
ncbi:MAG: hypothetical protein JW737_10160 [Acidobacteria bacterium]|nr:hypothetical protein [Acidobacteriota bacterium]